MSCAAFSDLLHKQLCSGQRKGFQVREATYETYFSSIFEIDFL